MFNFKEAESAKEISFLKPGVYVMKITEVKLDKFPKGQPYLGITFENAEGLKLTEKMGYSSEKALEVFISRLQYLHEAWSGKKLDKVLKSIEEVEAYFKKTFVNPKAGTKKIIIGGEVNGKNTYAALPFTGFITTDLDEGEFTEGDENWKKYVKASNRKSETTGKKGGILNEDGGDSTDINDAAADDVEDTPW